MDKSAQDWVDQIKGGRGMSRPGDDLDGLVASLASRVREYKVFLSKATGAEQATKGRFQRARVIKAAQQIISAVRPPTDQWLEHGHHAVIFTAVRLYIKWRVFPAIPIDGQIGMDALAEKTGVDVALLTRIAWVLVGAGILIQKENQLAHTPRSEVYATVNPFAAMTQMVFDDLLTGFVAMPKYFELHGRKEPTDKQLSITAFAEGAPGLSFWEVMNRDPERMKNFMTCMGTIDAMIPITGSYHFGWVGERAKSPNCPRDRMLLVDVGGAQGKAIMAICGETPGIDRTRCVLQDLPEVVQEARLQNYPGLDGIRMVEADFFHEQPVKGALVYYIRRCVHCYNDNDCVKILRNQAEAMTDDSRLLITEKIIEDIPPVEVATIDFYMLCLGGKERTIEGFEMITSRAGLKIIGVHGGKGMPISVIECMKV